MNDDVLREHRAADPAEPALTYPADSVGATAPGSDRRPPRGYSTLWVRTRLGTGEAVFRAASRALREWRMHRAMGVAVDAEAPRAATGTRVTVGLGVARLRVRGPCRVVWTLDGERRAGWAYGTLPGHPERGEEGFLVTHRADGTVWLEVRAFSVPGVWWTRAAGPLVRLFQRLYARRCGQVLRRLARRP
ncbi:DUF1990 domain-containing protein [Streptomyces sp. AJS327]|uniref:DUF1990 family protein n=1 Tax=Streptomyces sp. AJS327 TaxID=2545265 RepID=UPI0015DF739E|nr:DUF1990 domain-containing protein [Streptomyces sp. AJS327]MBA0051149.1 DUF1990 domain-containing protein [Streptomyces sp. AJS327]